MAKYEECFRDEFSQHIYWLNCSSPNIKPRKDFDGIDKNVRRGFRKGFEYFDKGIVYPKRHRGWTQTGREHCYHFIEKPWRLYGFVMIHKGEEDCYLCIFDSKKSDYTDDEVFNRLNRWRVDEHVLAVIAACKERESNAENGR